jgi:hypothetical protein
MCYVAADSVTWRTPNCAYLLQLAAHRRYFCNYVLAGLDFGSFAGYILNCGALLTTAPQILAFSMSINAKSCRHRSAAPKGIFRGFFHRFLAIYLVFKIHTRNLLFGGQVEIALGAFWAVRRSLNF